LLCDQFLLGAKESGHEAEKISLRDNTIHFCVACDTCQREGGRCVQKDDMAQILEKMISADVIVMATPVYFYSMSGQMKTLIDRTYARYTEIRGKDIYFIMTAADERKESVDQTMEGFRAFTSCLTGAREKGIIAGTGVWKKGEVARTDAMKQAFEMGQAL